MNDRLLLSREQEKLESQLIDLVCDWAAEHHWDSEEDISGEIAVTNSIFDETSIDDVQVEGVEDGQATFSLSGTLSGYPRKDDVPWCGDTINFSAEGTLSYDDTFDQWEVSDFWVTSASVYHPDDEENQYGLDISVTLIPEEILDNVDALFSKISKLPSNLWFRGHADEAWELKTSIARQKNPSLSLERQLRLSFENHSTFLNTTAASFGIEKTNFLMQHHGLPTRLLDWSLSPLTALYFAVCDKNQDHKDACLWVLDPSQLNRMHKVSFPHVWDGEKEDIFVEESLRVLAIHAPYTDLRMKMQQSEFTLHAHYGALEDELGSELYLKEKIVISHALKGEIRERLTAFGVTRGMLFPDLDNIAQSIRDEILD